MRVLHVISDENIGGAGILLLNLLRNFDSRRVQSKVALPKNSALAERIRSIGIPTIELTYACDRYSHASVRELKKILLNERYDLLHANAAVCARIAGKQCRISVLHTRHCFFDLGGIWKSRLVRAFGGAWNRALSDCVIATADAAAENLISLGIPRERIEVIINGSEPIAKIDTVEREAFLKKWNIAQDAFTVGICARLVSYKGHEFFLEAARILVEKAPHLKFCFLIAGEGPMREELEFLASYYGIEDKVRFFGFVSDMTAFYRSLRVNVSCSVGTETSCLALSEGMSAGVPMVVSDYGGNAAMVGESNAGIVYPAGDAEALANAILKIAADPALEQTMKQAAYERYRQCYTAAQMAERVTDLYERVVSQR